MGKKTHPKAFRLAVTHAWHAHWFADRDFTSLLREDIRIRALLLKDLREAQVDRVEIERSRQNVTINIFAAKPGVIIGRAGAGIEDIKKKLKTKFFSGRRTVINLNVKEVEHPELSARVTGLQIAMDIERRMPFRRIMKMAIERVMKGGAEGVKITLSGRLNGAEIARTETLAQGKIPLHNLRADIDFASVTAKTIYGAIGVKVWINRGEVFEEKTKSE
ncbi:30S ribosomal protein S3 [Candidatus Uhrbacteria bacterium RIFOXYB12_FULL_58_10]|uniref:Small ribosomal subunit protein uS3 n=1 Tax=Candidatus Uhrbacteria bacterium RIFOXYB2_FULL_57_15 TaxID=1802422 RepID=A0A1F7W8D9_9BACT|nr:MAG: 30S ribosomal protein S3 [Candidatus Uhrbacteria bacterium RIFOXYB12_FULL_58_10]OGL99029.1 MAG: 30S ribosomal protein S3 [Candidatus Uhrbacteria bacterium RIFOXYB2_FULL_57_15]OGM00249.1 MAG: 30S ribosomal protein S3 [Candidatus Uhrbacteria bacterium RIFOXYC12_FULL_57_11]